METTYIDQTAAIKNSTYSFPIHLYKNCLLSNSSLGSFCSVGDDSVVARSTLSNYVVINRRNYVNDSRIGAFSYTGLNTIINYSNIGKFCSIARNVDIGGFDHITDSISTLPRFRYDQMTKEKLPSLSESFSPDHLCQIGNDVWIAAGAIVLHKATVGNGAIIGAGSVVTKDVPPYSIVAGNPATVIKMRFSEQVITQLERLAWWNWPLSLIEKNAHLLFSHSLDEKDLETLIKQI